MQEAEVAGDNRGRLARSVGGADAGGDQAVDAVEVFVEARDVRAVVGAAMLLPRLGSEFLPELNEGSLYVTFTRSAISSGLNDNVMYRAEGF